MSENNEEVTYTEEDMQQEYTAGIIMGVIGTTIVLAVTFGILAMKGVI